MERRVQVKEYIGVEGRCDKGRLREYREGWKKRKGGEERRE